MGKPDLNTITVPRSVTASMLILASMAMAALIYFLTGRAVLHERASIADVVAIIRRYDSGSVPPSTLIAGLAPVITAILFFVPWGALAFLSFDRAGWRRVWTYAVTIAVGAAFALGLVAWQYRLPTRVTGWNDAAWNVAGVFLGAVAGHLRKRVRFRFQ